MKEIITKKSYAKVNIFLKIAGKRDNYHMLVSRFVRIKNLFDIIEFQVSNCDSFTLEGNFSCEIKKNTIYKAYKLLSNMFQNVKDYFKHHKIVVKKDIPEFAGLGGGSSNCATFILMVNDVCKLNLSKDILAEIGAKIGSDVPFFIYEYDSANVSGIGENVKQFNEEIPKFQIITPNIKCDTSVIFQRLRDGKFYCKIQKNEIDKLLKTKSIDILNTLSITEANDLYKPALYCNNKLQKYAKDNWFFSGSGSSFFKLVN